MTIFPLIFGSLGAPEILLIFLLVLILFGARRIPEIAQGLGKGIREFKKSMSEVKEEIERPAQEIEKSIKEEPKAEVKPESKPDENKNG